MIIHKCEICKKEIDSDKMIRVSVHEVRYLPFDFCNYCGKPVREFLESKKLIQKDKNKKASN